MFARTVRCRISRIMEDVANKSDNVQQQRSAKTKSKSAKNAKKSSKNSHKRSNKDNAIESLKWPSNCHCVVSFLHHNNDKLNVKNLVSNLGTIKNIAVFPKDSETSTTKVELSNSEEAKIVWKQFLSNRPPEVICVVPDNYMTLKNIKQQRKPSNQHSKKMHFAKYLSDDQVKQGIESGEIITGSIRVNPKKFAHAFISDENGRDILINGLQDRNRALSGDVVAVKINPENMWLIGSNDLKVGDFNVEKAVDEMQKTKISNGSESDKGSSSSNVAATEPLFKHSRKTGKVVAILEKRCSRSTTGHVKLDKTINGNKNFVLFSPLSSAFPRMFIHRNSFRNQLSNPDFNNILFVAKLCDWTEYENIPYGELCETIGKQGEIEPETTRILIDHDIDFSDFTEEVVKCLPVNANVFSDEEKKYRRDFTKECIFTVDPATAKDLDDALHCKFLPNGTFEIGVHIADVSHFVKHSTPVDKVASERCTSVYLVQRVIPMLPGILCEELCSLNPGVERFAFSVVWTMTEKGKILSEWFGKSIIRSCGKLSYDHAQSFIDNPTRNFDEPECSPKEQEFPEIFDGFSLTEIKEKILCLHKISKNLRTQRFKNGALRLDQVRLSYTLNPETGFPSGCYAYERKDSNSLIEEFMLLANIAVAHKIYKGLPTHAFLRSHPQPKETMMEDFVNHCCSIGLQIDSSSSESLAQSINTACGEDELSVYRKQALFMFAIKPQQLATYICAGTQTDESKYHHYALNVPLYTHFTSPIRRYADVLVHRQLAAILKLPGSDNGMKLSPEELQAQAELCNHRKYNAKLAQDLSIDLFFNLLVNSCGPLESTGMVMYVNDHSIDVLSIEYGVIKRIYMEALPGVCFKLEERLSDENRTKINVLKLKWLNITVDDIVQNDSPIPYSESADGFEQTLEVFSVVKMILRKKDPESATSIFATLKHPNSPDVQRGLKSVKAIEEQ